MRGFIFLLPVLLYSSILYSQSDGLIRHLKTPEPTEGDFSTEETLKLSIGLFYDHSPQDFLGFFPELEFYNIRMLNQGEEFFGLESMVEYNNFKGGLQFGFGRYTGEEENELRLGLYTFMSSFNLGYQLNPNGRLSIVPFFSLRYFRYRLTNESLQYDISLEESLLNNDLDLRFHRVTGLLGARIGYRVFDTGTPLIDTYTFGLYGGYLFPIHYNTLLYSRRNRLSHNGNMRYEGFSMGIFFSIDLWL